VSSSETSSPSAGTGLTTSGTVMSTEAHKLLLQARRAYRIQELTIEVRMHLTPPAADGQRVLPP
jgi:hypothetical protein